jgi:hypothetical protein
MSELSKLKPILEASYLNQAEASKKLKDLGYTYDGQLSTNESKVFVDAQGNPNIAFRGSKRVEDFLRTDVLQFVGLGAYDKRFQEAKRLTSLVEEKYGKPADVFGHSLGGKLAEVSGANGNIYTYNKATGLADIGKKIPDKQKDIRTTGDVVSAISTTQEHQQKMKQLNGLIGYVQGIIPAHDLSNLPDSKYNVVK